MQNFAMQRIQSNTVSSSQLYEVKVFVEWVVPEQNQCIYIFNLQIPEFMGTYNQWRSQARAHWGTCPSNWRLCPTSAGAPENYRCRMSIANWALKVRKGVEIELRSLATSE